MANKVKLTPLDRGNIMISVNDNYGEIKYAFQYNPDVQFKYEKYSNRYLVNINTKEKKLYKDLLPMINSKTGDLFLYPSTLNDLYDILQQYKINEWKFEDDYSLRDVARKDEMDRMRQEIESLRLMNEKLVKIIESDVTTAGFGLYKQKLALLEEIKAQMASQPKVEKTETVSTQQASVTSQEAMKVFQQNYQPRPTLVGNQVFGQNTGQVIGNAQLGNVVTKW